MLDIIPPWALACAIVLACAVLNRVRGGGFGGQFLPGRALFWVAPVIGLLAWTLNPWPIAVAFGLGYLAWGIPGWGYTLARVGKFTPDRPADGLDKLLLGLPVLAAVFVRMLFVLPGVAAVAWLDGNWWFIAAAVVFAGLVTLSYAVLFRPLGSHDWMRAEVATGVLWGALIAAPAFI